MRVSDSRQLLFVHVQKTGGSTIDAMLDEGLPDVRRVNGCSRHASLAAILAREPELARYWTFGFVRNPWSRMVSWWSMIQHITALAEAGGEAAVRKYNKNPMWRQASRYADFAEFVTRGPAEFAKLGRPQVNILSAGGRRADFVGRLETFDDDARALRARLRLQPLDEPPIVNPSPHAEWREYYTPALRDRVGELFRADVEAFGYRF